ncbi:MAG TPA: hypothetical protein VFW99_00340 [Candidatus Nitrosotalea sp.]|nr:hypothetical protein [Candidatus Nitrosotalea sp.]
MKPFNKKLSCEKCKKQFEIYEELVGHARHEHHQDIVKCIECGKEFIHEKDRLHHSREEHKKKLNNRAHKTEHKHEVENPLPQDDLDAHMRNFGDNF